AKEFPKDAEHPHVLGAILDNWAELLRAQGDLKGARLRVEQAIEQQLVALKVHPNEPEYREFLFSHYEILADVAARLGDHPTAAKAAPELPRLFPERWQAYLEAAGYLARCMAVAEKDPQLTDEQR